MKTVLCQGKTWRFYLQRIEIQINFVNPIKKIVHSIFKTNAFDHFPKDTSITTVREYFFYKADEEIHIYIFITEL